MFDKTKDVIDIEEAGVSTDHECHHVREITTSLHYLLSSYTLRLWNILLVRTTDR
jgi:hypothetical protein